MGTRLKDLGVSSSSKVLTFHLCFQNTKCSLGNSPPLPPCPTLPWFSSSSCSFLTSFPASSQRSEFLRLVSGPLLLALPTLDGCSSYLPTKNVHICVPEPTAPGLLGTCYMATEYCTWMYAGTSNMPCPTGLLSNPNAASFPIGLM